MNRMSIVILWALALLVLQPALAAEPRQQPTAREQARTVTIFHQPVVMLQATFGQTTPEERVLRTRSALRAFTEDDIRQPLRVVPVIRYGQPGRLFLMNGKPVLLLSQADLDEGDDLTLDQAAQRVLARMEAQRTSLQEQFNNRYLFISAGKALAGALLLALFYYGAFRAWRRVRRFFLLRILEKRSAIPQHWRRYLGNIEVRLYAVLVILLGMLACYLWLSWAFSLFPWTRVWSESLGDWSLGVIRHLSLSIVASLPGLMIVVLIFLLTWLIIRLVKVVLDQVAAGRIQIPGIHPETVSATRRLISVVIWLFALSAAYPFLPGANSLAFKGISVFFGLMLTLGSTGVMTHAMSGLVLIYSRALRKGDWIRLADNEGQVSEIGVLATKILTRENYIVTVPNAVVVSGKIINLSAESADGGVNLTTSVTIGYDTPWRQVHALLELAARRTPGIDQQIAPVVRKLGLLDWYTSYELQVRLLPTTKLPDGRNAMHSSIIDVFNEFGVQIMSPNFVMQPKVPGIHPETVSATRRLISVVIWLFALSAAYPFLPGANSLAFKGISVFFGLMLTLGSTGVMTHAMSGLVLIYSRALRKGDWIRLADNEGQVSEIGVLATKILTRENYIVTVPNAVVVSGKIINLSAESADGGVNLTTSVTIGYDTPWRQVHALLELAARRTPGIDQQIAPVVRKLGLLDWYTSYELQVRLLPTTKLPDGRNALHSSIIDVFNEFGVQIMSPNFVMQPKAAVVVPQEAWYAAPAVAPQKPEK